MTLSLWAYCWCRISAIHVSINLTTGECKVFPAEYKKFPRACSKVEGFFFLRLEVTPQLASSRSPLSIGVLLCRVKREAGVKTLLLTVNNTQTVSTHNYRRLHSAFLKRLCCTVYASLYPLFSTCYQNRRSYQSVSCAASAVSTRIFNTLFSGCGRNMVFETILLSRRR